MQLVEKVFGRSTTGSDIVGKARAAGEGGLVVLDRDRRAQPAAQAETDSGEIGRAHV